ncbi:MAG TPA: DUF6338 family protein [Xanthobacteraceae bacterium]|nr:DUF6338 family protein [Xanthobacteraceae bacterium]
MQGIDDFFKEFDWSKLATVALFALPGFISLRVWSLIFPTSQQALKDQLGEALSFGILNAMICAPLFFLIEPTTPLALYGLAILTLVLLPAVWPFPTLWLMQALQKWDVILITSRSAWDDVFLRDEPYFIIVHLADGDRIGGYYGSKSFAGLHPISGHLYLEQLWFMDDQGKFTSPVPDSRGLILRPNDYKFVELMAVPKEATDGRSPQ